MPGTLYVVATPIGNLEDVTLRALRVLREVAVIAAEDTRRTARLLQHYSISTPTTSLHEHNEYARTPRLVERLLAGDSVALVSDAGTPAISDPGSQLVTAAHAAGVRVEPIPGPNAAVAALSASGIASDAGFVFSGFPPAKAVQRRKWLRAFASEQRPIVIYEAPHRITATLSDIHYELGDRHIAIAREMTKAHENLVVRQISWWLEHLPPERGEFVVVIAPRSAVQERSVSAPTDSLLSQTFGRLTDSDGLDRRAALKETGRQHGVSARDVFNALERTKNLGK
jgi:16S rRNA (cytidine1402-2'-O)-methyltransferase